MNKTILEILENICDEDFSDSLDVDLFEDGYIDSLGLAQLVVEVEEELGIELSLTDLNREEISTPQKIIDFLNNQI